MPESPKGLAQCNGVLYVRTWFTVIDPVFAVIDGIAVRSFGSYAHEKRAPTSFTIGDVIQWFRRNARSKIDHKPLSGFETIGSQFRAWKFS